MKIHIIAIGQRMPAWVNEVFHDYAKRLPRDYHIILNALATEKRTPSTAIPTLIKKESHALLSACPPHTYRVALDRQGQTVTTEQIAQKLYDWHEQSQDIAFLIGGPEGISETALNEADAAWSLSKLTLPHPLVRVLVAEQIYRAWSILSHHPYHR